ncbi:MAG: sulfite exporter TauE/SafE family protein [Saprospiraceae bacterium]|nr:sulfite exporter TauE/SafE family protein [Saprospiraceae bacterium]MBK8450796.1 sulfite exporter TauE/SafE family protein [Saprospiraceae bacterium]
MEYIIVILFSFLGSLLTFYSGFGLGTILLPVFTILVSVEVAIIMTAIVHFLNNFFKLFLTYGNIDFNILKSFGLISLFTSILGAIVFAYFYNSGWSLNYSLLDYPMKITMLKLIIGSLLIVFVLLEFSNRLKTIQLNKNQILWGGILSGFFGGLSGHQGALRSAFLSKAGLNKHQFIATGIACACLVDIGRLWIYGKTNFSELAHSNLGLIGVALISAFSGAWLGNKYIQKISSSQLQTLICICLIGFAVLMIVGFI